MSNGGSVERLDRLLARLENELDGSVSETQLLGDGLNLILGVSTEQQPRAYVLRQPRKLREVSYINDLDREYEILKLLHETSIPTPEPIAFCPPTSDSDEAFIVTTWMEGSTVPRDGDPPSAWNPPAAREQAASALIDCLVKIHSVDCTRFEGAASTLSPSDLVERSTRRIETAAKATGYDATTLLAVADWLLEYAPANSPTTLIHGDYRPGNVLFSGENRPRLTGIIDWETAMLGDPLLDLGYLLFRWPDPDDPIPPLEPIERKFGDEVPIGDLQTLARGGLCGYPAGPGCPSRRDLVDWYEAETGFTLENERFYRAYGAFALATVWLDLHRDCLQTEGDSDWGPPIAYLTSIASAIIRENGLLEP